jgi:hypothetical protein
MAPRREAASATRLSVPATRRMVFCNAVGGGLVALACDSTCRRGPSGQQIAPTQQRHRVSTAGSMAGPPWPRTHPVLSIARH